VRYRAIGQGLMRAEQCRAGLTHTQHPPPRRAPCTLSADARRRRPDSGMLWPEITHPRGDGGDSKPTNTLA
jgi:hypothetical protein